MNKAAIPNIPASFPLDRDVFIICVPVRLLRLGLKSQPALCQHFLPGRAAQTQNEGFQAPASLYTGNPSGVWMLRHRECATEQELVVSDCLNHRAILGCCAEQSFMQ
jgi:hypothetical protein